MKTSISSGLCVISYISDINTEALFSDIIFTYSVTQKKSLKMCVFNENQGT